MTRALRSLLLLSVLANGALALSREGAQAELDKAMKLFDDFEDQKASALLTNVLKHAPSPDQAARAHVYLGLIALNALKTDKARAEFKQALIIDATTELPFEASPKARLTYDQARREVEQEAQQGVEKPRQPVQAQPANPTGSSAAAAGSDDETGDVPPERPVTSVPRTRTLVVENPEQPTPLETGPDYAPAIVVGAVGVGALIGGAIVGAISTTTLAQANANTDITPAEQLAAQAGTQGLIADILFGVGGVGVATGIILLVVEASSGGHVSSAVHADANGLSVSF